MQIEREGDWFSGLTDGDGTFSFSPASRKKKTWSCTFKISASLRNWRLLEHCRQFLGRGRINPRSGKGAGEYRIRHRKSLRAVILPLFQKHPLYTSKAFYFHRWCRALEILEGAESAGQKDAALHSLRQEHPPTGYRAPAWQWGAPSAAWICGFVEAEGSFHITNKEGRYVHSFGCTQKFDAHVLEHMRKKLHIPAGVIERRPLSGASAYYKLESSNFRALCRMAQFFRGQFRGRKGLEHRIWQRTLRWRGNNSRLQRIQRLLRDLRQLESQSTY